MASQEALTTWHPNTEHPATEKPRGRNLLGGTIFDQVQPDGIICLVVIPEAIENNKVVPLNGSIIMHEPFDGEVNKLTIESELADVSKKTLQISDSAILIEEELDGKITRIAIDREFGAATIAADLGPGLSVSLVSDIDTARLNLLARTAAQIGSNRPDYPFHAVNSLVNCVEYLGVKVPTQLPQLANTH